MTRCPGVIAVVVLALLATGAAAQDPWKRPPQRVVDIIDAPPTPRVILNPTRTRALLVTYDAYPSLEVLARPFLKLAGHRVDPELHARQRIGRNRGLEILDFEPVARRAVKLPADAAINAVRWSPDGARFAFTNDRAGGAELWIGDAATGEAHPVAGARLTDVLAAPFAWLDTNTLILAAVPAGRGAPPQPPRVPDGPVIDETSGKQARAMTFQDLLRNTSDEALFEYYATTQLMTLDIASGKAAPIGRPLMASWYDASPDGAHLLVTHVKRPFSYRLPSSRFPRATEVWTRAGEPIRVVADLPLADEVPTQGVPTGPRGIHWQPLVGSTLVWTEALDGGDPLRKAPHRDRLMTLAAPFQGDAREVMKLTHRFAGFDWAARPDETLVAQYDRARRWSTTSVVNLKAPAEARVAFDLSVNDAYSDPGSAVLESRPDGTSVMVQDGDWAYFAGDGASEEGARPFLDRLNLKTLEKVRLWQSAADAYETFVHFPGADRERIITRHQSRTEPPNYYVVNLKSGERHKLTDFKDPAPELTKVRKQILKYKRADGVQLSGTLYLPPDYQEGTRLPLIVWAYPEEYSDPATAGQVRGSAQTFTRLAGDSPLFFLLNGYAVLDDATMPVIGDPETMNDTFVEQIVSSARAAVDTVSAMGIADPDRACVAGHSYGAFMTANLLAHCDVFAAGIARSGAYNRSLTPFGFQSERRSYWEALDVYTKLSPFTYANRINEPLLIIHGDSDNNPGTHTMQSERLFQAIRGTGGTARLVLLPHESHGYRARESILHVLAEMFEWADRHVKNRKSVD